MLATRQLTRLARRLRPSAATVHSRYLSTLQPSESAETSSAWAITSAGALAALFAVNLAAAQGSASSAVVEDPPETASATGARAANVETSVDDYDDDLPIYSSDEVAKHNGKTSQSIWMSYGGNVYDVTDFVANHPGGSEKIMLAAGGCIEPHWHCKFQSRLLSLVDEGLDCFSMHSILVHQPVPTQCTGSTSHLICRSSSWTR